MKKGTLYIISGPSGVGKGSVIKEVLKYQSEIYLAISACTRSPRINEKNKKTYYFLSDDEFNQKIKENAFLEWCNVHTNKYGTLKSEVEPHINNGKDVIIEIDVQGAEKIINTINYGIRIFIAPPTFEDLRLRLEGRNTESSSKIEKRLQTAKKELKEMHKYDIVITNNKLDDAVKSVLKYINSRRNKHDRAK